MIEKILRLFWFIRCNRCMKVRRRDRLEKVYCTQCRHVLVSKLAAEHMATMVDLETKTQMLMIAFQYRKALDQVGRWTAGAAHLLQEQESALTREWLGAIAHYLRMNDERKMEE